MLYSFSNLESKDLNSLKKLENTLGKRILAFSGHKIKLAELSAKQLESVKKLEEELGIVLIVTDS